MKPRSLLAVVAAVALTLGMGLFSSQSASAQMYTTGGQTYVLGNYVAPGGQVVLPDGTVIGCPNGCPAGETFTTQASYTLGTPVYGATYSTYAPVLYSPYAAGYTNAYGCGYSVAVLGCAGLGYYGGGLTWPGTSFGFSNGCGNFNCFGNGLGNGNCWQAFCGGFGGFGHDHDHNGFSNNGVTCTAPATFHHHPNAMGQLCY